MKWDRRFHQLISPSSNCHATKNTLLGLVQWEQTPSRYQNPDRTRVILLPDRSTLQFSIYNAWPFIGGGSRQRVVRARHEWFFLERHSFQSNGMQGVYAIAHFSPPRHFLDDITASLQEAQDRFNWVLASTRMLGR